MRRFLPAHTPCVARTRNNVGAPEPSLLRSMPSHFVNGRPHTPASSNTIDVIDPSTGEVFGQLARGDAADIDAAVAAARGAADIS
jgi:hypothetical protein